MSNKRKKKRITTAPTPKSREARERELKEIERMMRHDSYSRRNGSIHQTRHS